MSSAWLLAMVLASQQLAPSAAMPPAGSPPVVRVIEIAFPAQGNVSVIEPATYLFYIQSKPSRPSAGVWVPYERQTALDDFRRLWATGFLDDLEIEVLDEPYENGVIGKHIVYKLEERARVKIVDFEGSTALERSKIDDALKEAGAQIRIDAFLDPGVVHRVEGIVAGMLRDKGFQAARVTHALTAMPGGPKQVHLVFRLDSGPEVRLRAIRFTGNKVFSDRVLAGEMKSNRTRQPWLPSFLRRRATFQASKFEEDADLVTQFYRDRGYVAARVEAPEIRTVRNDRRRKTRWVDLVVPVSEGSRYRVGRVEVEGNTIVKAAPLKAMFKLRTGEYYHEKTIRKGLEKAREAYGAVGFFEFTGYPELKPRERPDRKGRAVLDVTLRMEEGKQYFVNRLTFKGNTVTRDNVIRRELAIHESGVFNTEALKYSVKRLNQLGYFKPLDGAKAIQIDKTPDADNRVDVTLNVEEQNRNQIQFGAGMSQYDGVYGSASYTAANFLGRGESMTVALQRGSRSNVYQVAFTEPYLFDRPISAGIEVYSRKYDYLMASSKVGYSEVREGASWSIGRPAWRFSRGSLNYTYEIIDSSISQDLLGASLEENLSASAGMPFFNPFYDQGRHVDSRVTPGFSYNTVDNPMVPHSGMRITGSTQVASRRLGGSYDYTKQEGEAVLFLPTSRRTGFGFRAEGGWLRPYGSTKKLPYYFRYFLGGEYQIRGVDIRSVGPVDSNNRALGGDKYVLFNAEYYLDVAGPVRAVLFHDAGQAFAESQPINLRQLRTSSGVELRFVVPMLNVPFRLIYAWNLYRDTFQPARTFKFAVGTTF